MPGWCAGKVTPTEAALSCDRRVTRRTHQTVVGRPLWYRSHRHFGEDLPGSYGDLAQLCRHRRLALTGALVRQSSRDIGRPWPGQGLSACSPLGQLVPSVEDAPNSNLVDNAVAQALSASD